MTEDLWSSLVETVRRDPARVAFVQQDEETTFGQWMRRALDYVA